MQSCNLHWEADEVETREDTGYTTYTQGPQRVNFTPQIGAIAETLIELQKPIYQPIDIELARAAKDAFFAQMFSSSSG